MYAKTLAQELGLEEKKDADEAEESVTERADQASKNKRSFLFTAVLKLLFCILFTVGTVYQHPDLANDSVCRKCEEDSFWESWSCTDDIVVLEQCMKSYKFGPMIGGAIVFCLSIIIETFWVNYILYFKPTTGNHIMCGVYAIGSLVIMVAAILELEMDEYYDNNIAFQNFKAVWIVGGILCLISQLYWAWILKSKNLLVMVAYIPAIAATLLWIIAGEFNDNTTLPADLMISSSVLYIFHALFWFGAVYGTVSSQSKLKSQAQAQLEEGLKVMK
ncbi:predicted protein [Chaetoceros tenuissimus]|uniref:Uncharacterized protein n=1 Tax=Chaetoceros tenuissimus TaxID=426638 RepID=A0AAD3HAQ9_9STRA|nr:predicted protein [Chaetoceros tenuissimus]